ncbi:MAG: hypothetical protein JRN67_12705 [Nitrososphaerota archaeon]|nr:hypothetical protein [Nitrososphaerota archaeon]
MEALQRYLPDFQKLVLLALLYAAIALGYSFIGFLHPQFGSHYHEYSFPNLIVEISGHFVFGFVAAIPFLDLGISLLAGAAAVLIDADHVLSALNYNVSGRPDHSFLFILVSMAILILMARLGNLSESFQVKLSLLAPVILFAHISFDIFIAGGDTSFQLLIPFSFAFQTFPFYYWVLFETAALLLSLIGYFMCRRRTV